MNEAKKSKTMVSRLSLYSVGDSRRDVQLDIIDGVGQAARADLAYVGEDEEKDRDGGEDGCACNAVFA